jgi:hypothetical protein
MPVTKQITIEITTSKAGLGAVAGLSTSDTEKLKEMYPNSPIHNGIMTPPDTSVGFGTVVNPDGSTTSLVEADPDIRVQFQRLVMDGNVKDFSTNGMTLAADAGFNFNSFNRDFHENGAPDMTKVPVGAKGLPASPYVPNPSSSPTTEPADQHPPPAKFLKYDNSENTAKSSRPPFIGEGTVLTPHVSSQRTAEHKVGQYLMGKSDLSAIGAFTTPTPTETSDQDWIPPEAIEPEPPAVP